MQKRAINNILCYCPLNTHDLISYSIKKKKILIAINAEKIIYSSIKFKKLINRNIGYPDGFGAVWALKKKGIRDVIKIPGCELWLEIIKYYVSNKTFYLVGGTEEVIHQTITKLKAEYSSIQIVGFRNGYFNSEDERQLLLQDIVQKKPDVVFVGIGSPKQEFLMNDMQLLHPALYQGLGGSFDVYTGFVKRAPEWWVKNNLEWAYRLLKQPIRIKRQVHLVRFFIKLMLGKL